MDDMTWKAAMDSEIFREYAMNWLRKDAHMEATKAEAEIDMKATEEKAVQESFEEFKKKVAENPALEMKLKQARDYLNDHPEMVDRVDPNFVQGINLLFASPSKEEELPVANNEVIEVSEE